MQSRKRRPVVEDDDDDEIEEDDEHERELTRAILWDIFLYHRRITDHDAAVREIAFQIVCPYKLYGQEI